MSSFLENLTHLNYQEDPGEAEGEKGAEHEKNEPKEDKLGDLCQRWREWW